MVFSVKTTPTETPKPKQVEAVKQELETDEDLPGKPSSYIINNMNKKGSNTLFEAIKKQEWKKVVTVAKRSPSLAEQTFQVKSLGYDEYNCEVNAMQLACAHMPPPEVIQSLNAAKSSLVFDLDSQKRLVLHIAAMNGAPLETMKLLVRLNPNAMEHQDLDGRVPLHYAAEQPQNADANVRMLLKVNPDSAIFQDIDGLLPLHIACQQNTNLNVIKMLIRVAPDSIMIRTNTGRTPIACVKQSKQDANVEEIVGMLERLASESVLSVR